MLTVALRSAGFPSFLVRGDNERTGHAGIRNIPEHFTRSGDLAAGPCWRDDLAPTQGRRPGSHS